MTLIPGDKVPLATRPRCITCGKPCKPIYKIVCRDCGHHRFDHALQDGGHCYGNVAGKVCTCPHVANEAVDAGVRDRASFHKVFAGYDRYGLFHSDQCAVTWAIANAPRRKAGAA